MTRYDMAETITHSIYDDIHLTMLTTKTDNYNCVPRLEIIKRWDICFALILDKEPIRTLYPIIKSFDWKILVYEYHNCTRILMIYT
jgi:hypothetical protein